MPWNYDLRFVSEETWIKSSFSVGVSSEAICLLCTAEAPRGEITISIHFIVEPCIDTISINSNQLMHISVFIKTH